MRLVSRPLLTAKFLLPLALAAGTLKTGAQENLVANGSFEAPAAMNQLPGDGWWLYEGRGTLTAKEDRTFAHGGEGCVRLQADADAKGVLVSRSFAVAPGDKLRFQAWVRGAGNDARHASTYAGVAFRRANGSIIERAYFSSGPLGEQWSMLSGLALAPPETVSAEAHLGYTNAPGTVWFDDVFVAVTNLLSLSMPEDTKPWPGRQEITVRVANRQANQFRGKLSFSTYGEAESVPVLIDAKSVREFQAPITLTGAGAHEYTLSLFDSAGTLQRTLRGKIKTFTAFELAPACPCYHLAGQGNGETRVDGRVNLDPAERAGLELRVELLDPSGRPVQRTNCDASTGDLVGLNVRVPVAAPGVFQISARLISRSGATLGVGKTDVRVIATGSSHVGLGPEGFLQIGDAPHFPIGMYNCGHYEEMAQAGFSVTHEYSVAKGESQSAIDPTDGELQRLLDKSWTNGLRMMVELPRQAVNQGKWEPVRRRIEAFKHHPGLLCWGSEERVARGEAPLANIAKLYALVKELDPDHPLVLGDSRDVIQKMQQDRRDFFPDADMDAGIWWWYPIPLKEPDGYGLEGAAEAADQLEPPSWLTTTLSKKPLWIAIQAYQKPKPDAPFPTPAQYRCMAYLSLIHGAKGLFFYTGSGQRDYLGKPAGLLNKPEEAHWEYVKHLAGELREFSALFIKSRAIARPVMEPKDAPVDFSLREVGGRLLLLAANKSGRSQKVRLCSSFFKDQKAKLLYEEGPVTLEQGTLVAEFPPFAVHVYIFGTEESS